MERRLQGWNDYSLFMRAMWGFFAGPGTVLSKHLCCSATPQHPCRCLFFTATRHKSRFTKCAQTALMCRRVPPDTWWNGDPTERLHIRRLRHYPENRQLAVAYARLGLSGRAFICDRCSHRTCSCLISMCLRHGTWLKPPQVTELSLPSPLPSHGVASKLLSHIWRWIFLLTVRADTRFELTTLASNISLQHLLSAFCAFVTAALGPDKVHNRC